MERKEEGGGVRTVFLRDGELQRMEQRRREERKRRKKKKERLRTGERVEKEEVFF